MKSETFTISLEKGAQDAIPFYGPGQPFGFVDEAAHNAQPELNIFELNSGFNVPYWCASEIITKIQQDENGCFLDSDALVKSLWKKDGAVQPPQRFIPLCFKTAVPHAGNYRVKLTLTARAEEEQFLIFHGCRHLAWKGSLRQGAVLSICFTVNISPIIPNGKDHPFEKMTLDIAVVGHCPALDFLSVTPVEVPTVYLAGDSTMADYGAEYPYHPAACYGGWGQALDLYLDGSIAVCNHAHNGRSTETFRNEGHFDLIQKQLRPGDFVVIQFDHNDQKHPHLQAYNGYPENLRRFIEEIRAKKALPILATPIARNTWTEQNGKLTYNDLLHDHAQACIALGKELNVPVLDLHQAAMEDIIRLGRDASKAYYHQGDWTHTNDYGAVRAAGYAANALRSLGGAFPDYLPLIQAVSVSIKPWKPEAALLLEKPVRLAGVKDPNGTEEGTAAQDHQAEKDGGDALARLLAAVQSARGQGG